LNLVVLWSNLGMNASGISTLRFQRTDSFKERIEERFGSVCAGSGGGTRLARTTWESFSHGIATGVSDGGYGADVMKKRYSAVAPRNLRYTHKCENITHSESGVMRTNIDIDDDLMRQAIRLGGAATKKATVETALRLLIQTRSQVGMRRFRGKVKWEGNLEESRRGRNTE
jgi:Arc/MetJ family transcription regulator